MAYSITIYRNQRPVTAGKVTVHEKGLFGSIYTLRHATNGQWFSPNMNSSSGHVYIDGKSYGNYSHNSIVNITWYCLISVIQAYHFWVIGFLYKKSSYFSQIFILFFAKNFYNVGN